VEEGGHFKFEANETRSLGMSPTLFRGSVNLLVDMNWGLLHRPVLRLGAGADLLFGLAAGREAPGEPPAPLALLDDPRDLGRLPGPELPRVGLERLGHPDEEHLQVAEVLEVEADAAGGNPLGHLLGRTAVDLEPEAVPVLVAAVAGGGVGR
jgi:hypothetical protein